MRELLIKYAGFNYWANNLLLSVTENQINDELLDREIISSFPSLRKTIYHIWDAEDIWFRRLNGESAPFGVSKNFNGAFFEAKQIILSIDKTFIDYVGKLNDEKLVSLFEYKNIEGKAFSNPVWEAIQHCINHSTYHRGQMVTILRQLGITSIPSTDFITYCRM